jgi:hypothetical protein
MAKLAIPRETYDALGFDLDAALAAFAVAKDEHRFTINVPAPTAHPMVERAYARGGYVIVEEETGKSEADPQSLTSRVAALEALLAKRGII